VRPSQRAGDSWLLRRAVCLLTAVVLGSVAASAPALASSEPPPSISAYNEPGIYGFHSWMPATATIATSRAVKFANPYGTTYHGLQFTGGSAGTTPSCTGIPAAAGEVTGAVSWQGECTFSAPGTYTFICTVHPAEMKGTITVKTPGTPTVTTEAATELTHATARLNGSLNPEGNAAEYRFDYGTGTVSEHATGTLGLSAEDFSGHPVSAALSGLTPGAEYHVRLVAIYGAGKTTVLGGERTFTAPVPGAPTVATAAATGVTQNGATLNGTVDADEGEGSEYSFEYGTSAAYGQSTEAKSLPADRVNRAAAATVMGLVPGTEYHYRLVAHNDLGPAIGEDRTFTTASAPAPSAETPPSSSSPPSGGSSGTAQGTPLGAFAPTLPAAGALPGGSPFAGGPHALRLAALQRGASVRGSIGISAAGAGGALEVAVFAPGASLAGAHRPAGVRVGRLRRASVHAGAVSFAVALSARARAALRRHHRLGLTVQIVLTPLAGAPARVTRSMVLRG
jgi:plastocyanin